MRFFINCSAVICSPTVIHAIMREATSETYGPGVSFLLYCISFIYIAATSPCQHHQTASCLKLPSGSRVSFPPRLSEMLPSSAALCLETPPPHAMRRAAAAFANADTHASSHRLYCRGISDTPRRRLASLPPRPHHIADPPLP